MGNLFRVSVGSFKTTELMRTYVNEVLDSDRLTYGPFCQQFERGFAALHGSEYGVLSNSGTSSLQVALQALKELNDWPNGSEVIIPATTFVATANIVIHNGMIPVLVDVDAVTYNIDPDLIAKSITTKTKAIIPVHLFGQPANMSAIMQLARLHGLAVIEDSCETVMATHNGIKVGSFGDVGCFSMYTAHHLAAGVGGISVTRSKELADIMRSLVNHGRDNAYIKPEDSRNLETLSDRFRFRRLGHSFRITEFEAAIALAQLTEIKTQIKRRAEIAAFYVTRLNHLPLMMPQVRRWNTHSWMMFPIVCKHNFERDELVAHLEENGIETRPMLPLLHQPVYGFLGWKASLYPVADWIDRNGFYVGCHQDITDSDADFLVNTIRGFYD